jgi:hypothetical protein
MTLTYVPAENTRPFRRGESVLVLSRDGEPIGKQRITRVNRRTVKTDCGRTWSSEGEYYSDGVAYPFPTIKPEVE